MSKKKKKNRLTILAIRNNQHFPLKGGIILLPRKFAFSTLSFTSGSVFSVVNSPRNQAAEKQFSLD